MKTTKMKNLDFSIRFAIRTYLNLAVNMRINISEFFGVYQFVDLVPLLLLLLSRIGSPGETI